MARKTSTAWRLRRGHLALIGTSLWALALPVQAQSQVNAAAQPTPDESADSAAHVSPAGIPEETIVVTGSRAAGAGFTAPTPTTVVSGAAIDQRQATNVAQVLNEIPAFRASTSPGANAIRTQTPGSNTADLRGLGAHRTLVLINGARVVPLAAANNNGAPVAVDLNQVPTLMIDRLEVVTGGASAQWGSDAVAGVVNIILKNRFEGVQLRAQAGITEAGDGMSWRMAALAGASFADDRGHVVAGFDFESRERAGDIYTRDWGRLEYGRVTNQCGPTAVVGAACPAGPNGQPASIIAPNVHASTSPGGLITGPAGFALVNNTFLPGGTGVRPYSLGAIRNATTMIGGEGRALAYGVSLAPGVERFDPYVRAEFDFGNVTVFAEGAYALSTGNSVTLPPRDSAITIFRDNAFLPASVRAAMGARPSFTMSRVDWDIGNARVTVKNETPHVMVGAKGDLGADWDWDAHASWGKNIYVNEVAGNRIISNFRFATDAVVNPANGQIVCRATLPGAGFNAAAAGCVPINLFGEGSPTPEAIDYVTGTSRSTSDYWQKTAAINLRGQPFSTWAGPVSIALGGEYRHEKQVVDADPIARVGGFEAANGTAYSGKFDVIEGYVEAIVPLARDMPFLETLDVNGAVRLAEYSSAGSQTTWKVGATWEPLSGLRFRGTRSRDIRAPAIFELFSPGTISNLPVSIGPVTANIPQNSTIGNAALAPEIANTTTVGVVLQPAFVPGLSVSVDYFNIELEQAITSIAGGTAGTLCAQGQAYFCGLFTYNAGGVPTAYNGRFINAAALNPEGLDIVGSYRLPLDRISASASGSLTFSFSGTYMFHWMSDLGTGAAPVDFAGENGGGGAPRFRSNSSVTYSNGGLDATLQLITISGGKIDANAGLSPATSININEVKAVQYLNSQISYEVNERLKVFGSVNNLLDTDPPVLPNAGLFTVTNGVYYDTLGRSFSVGFDARF